MKWSKLYIGLAICISIFLSFSTLKHPENLIWSDMEGYYVYLPSVFIYGDFVKDAVKDTNYIKTYQDTDKIYTKYTCGVAIMEMPFFLATHLYAKISNGNTDGKNALYGRGLALAGLFYFWLGVFFLYKVGRKYYSKQNLIISLIAIFVGTNLYYYTYFQPAMSHVFSFCLLAIFLWMTDYIFVRKDHFFKNLAWSWILFGFIFGMIVLVRPTNIIVAILPIYIWTKTTENKLLWLKAHLGVILMALAMFFITFTPQFLYWKYISGQWFIYSYGHESFSYWKEPKLFRVLFDAWNGWILYSPVVVLPLWYLFKGRNTNKNFERAYLIIFAVATYLFASWWAWWFGGAFGHRSYVELLAFLVLPLAGLLDEIKIHRATYFIVLGLLGIMCYYSIGLTYAYRAPWDGDNWTYQNVLYEVKKLFFLH